MKESKQTDSKINLRDLDDTACTNVVCTRQIKKMIRKFPSMSEISFDCWVKSGHYTKFKFKNDRFIWTTDNGDSIANDSEDLDKYDLNKLIVFTYQAMCDSQAGVDLTDTPEDLLAYAETKLLELLHDEEASEVASN